MPKVSPRDARGIAVAILGDEPFIWETAHKKLAGAYLDLLRATENYWRQSLPYAEDEDAAAASEALRPWIRDVESRP